MGYQETPGRALERASLGFVRAKKGETRGTGGLGIFEVGLCKTSVTFRGMEIRAKQREEKNGQKRDQSHVNPHWSVYLSDQALHSVTTGFNKKIGQTLTLSVQSHSLSHVCE